MRVNNFPDIGFFGMYDFLKKVFKLIQPVAVDPLCVFNEQLALLNWEF